MMRLVLVPLVGIAVGACAPPAAMMTTTTTAATDADAPAAPPPPPPPMALRISGLADGQDVELVAGAQGGFHVWMQYALDGAAAGTTVVVERSARRVADGAVVLVYRGDVDVGAPADDGWWPAPAPAPMFMCPSPIGISIVGVRIEYQLRVLGDGDVERARAAITLVPRCPQDPAQQAACTRICTG